MQLMKEKHIYSENQMTLFSTINYDYLMQLIQEHSPSMLILSMYDKDMFEFLLKNWTQFNGKEALELIKQKKYEYLDSIPLNIIIDGKTPLDIYPDLRKHTKQYVLKAKTLGMIGNGDPKTEINALIENSKFDFKTLYIINDDIDIDIEDKYKIIRDASFLKSILFVKNYFYVPFRERANKDPYILQSFMSVLRESLSWDKTKLELYLKNKEKYKVYHIAKILECMNKKVESYKKQLSILELHFLFYSGSVPSS